MHVIFLCINILKWKSLHTLVHILDVQLAKIVGTSGELEICPVGARPEVKIP